MKEEIKAGATFLGCSVGLWAFIGVLAIAGTFISLLLWPTFNNLWLKGFHSTNEYNTSKISLIYTLIEQSDKNDVKIAELGNDPANADAVNGLEAQNKTISTRVRREVKLLDDANSPVPGDIRTWLNSHR